MKLAIVAGFVLFCACRVHAQYSLMGTYQGHVTNVSPPELFPDIAIGESVSGAFSLRFANWYPQSGQWDIEHDIRIGSWNWSLGRGATMYLSPTSQTRFDLAF